MLETSPQKFGRYEVRDQLGTGAMGVVYKAFDPMIGRMVAIKTIKATLELPPHKRQEYLERFRREAQAAGGASDHPNIVPVFDVGVEGELPFIVMAYVEGDSLDRMRRKSKFDDAALESLTRDICSALGHVHRKATIHRDVKPANIIMTPRGAMLTDFGIARLDGSELTRAGTFLGSPSYMSPEQVRGAEVSGASDLFSMAVILYLIITGDKPFRGEDTNEILYKIVHEKHIPPSIIKRDLDRWDDFFDKALAKNSADRFTDAEQFYRAFARVIEPEASASVPPLAAPQTAAQPAGAAKDRVNPLADRSMFFNVDVKSHIPSRRNSSTDTGRMERLLRGPRRRGRGKLPPAVWVALLAAALAFVFIVVKLWPAKPVPAKISNEQPVTKGKKTRP